MISFDLSTTYVGCKNLRLYPYVTIPLRPLLQRRQQARTPYSLTLSHLFGRALRKQKTQVLLNNYPDISLPRAVRNYK